MSEPTFTVQEVADLFGAPYSRVMRWITQERLAATGERKRGSPLSVTPSGLLAFVRQHGDQYDAEAITDELLKAEARKHRRSALDALHTLLKGTPQPQATTPSVAPKQVSPGCPKCASRMVAVQDDDGPVWKCLACGQSAPRRVA